MKIDKEKLLASAPQGYFWELVSELHPFPDKTCLVFGSERYQLRSLQRAVDWGKVSDGVTLHCEQTGWYFIKGTVPRPSVDGISTKHWVKSRECPFDESTCNYVAMNTHSPTHAFWRFTGLKENCVYDAK